MMNAPAFNHAADYLNIVVDRLPVVGKILDTCGHLPLADYVKCFDQPPFPGIQSRDDIKQAVMTQVSPVLGRETAARTAEDLSASGTVMTTTHLGIDFFANSVQGNLIYGSGVLTGRLKRSTIPILSFGNVPLNSSTFARGLLVYGTGKNQARNLPLRLPIYADSQKRTMASLAKPFTREMVQKTIKTANSWHTQKLISRPVAETIITLLDQVYCSDHVLHQTSYAAQATAANQMIGKYLVKTGSAPADLVYLEIEQIAACLVMKDLADEATLVHRAFFNSDFCNKIIKGLDGCPGCWLVEKLAARDTATGKPPTGSTGTIFFWGIDRDGRRIPLFLKPVKGCLHLCGRTDSGNGYDVAFTREELCLALETRKLLPSLFTCFLVLCFARGLTCVGGVFQGGYLTWMKNIISQTLQAFDDSYSAGMINSITTNLYQDGMLACMIPGQGQELIPAGPLEIIQSGGITRANLIQALDLTVKQAHMAGLFGALKDADADLTKTSDWQSKVARACYNTLSNHVVLCRPA